jgi:spore coat protein A
MGAAGGQAHYEIAITQFTQKLHRDLPATTVWGFAGSYPGPTLETTRDLPITVTWINDLRDSLGSLRTNHYLNVDLCLHGPDMEGATARIVTHLHGGHVPPESDGYPEDTILPGETDTYFYPNTQLPATLWYHDHALGITRLNVYMGLAGFYLVRDATEASLGLPSGEFEIPLAVQDRMFHGDGSLQYPALWDEHFFGDKVLVNGKVWPFLNVKKGKYRFRVLNGSNSRTYTLAFSNGAAFHQIGTDGGLLPAPVPLTSLTLTPGERADVVMDFASYATGTEIVLTNSAPAPYPGDPGAGVIPNVMKFIVQAATGHTNALPGALRPIETLQETNSVFTRELTLRKQSDECTGSKWLINDLEWHDITDFPVLGTTEVWSFINRSGVVHPMHMHLVMFQALDRQPFTVISNQIVTTGPRVPPAANEAGWKDTVRVDSFTITRVIARFEGYAGKFPYHCHVLEHEDHEMMRQFQILPPGDVNADTRVSGADSLLINQVLVGLRSTTSSVFHGSGYLNGDINATTNVSGADSLLINQSLVGLRPYLVTEILPTRRTNIAPVPVTIFGVGFPTNSTPTVTIGPPVSLTLTNVSVLSREQIHATVPIGGGIGTGIVNVIAGPTNGVISFGRFINQ